MTIMPWNHVVCEGPAGHDVGAYCWCEISLDSQEVIDGLVELPAVEE